MRVLVTADTHVPGFARALPAQLVDAARRADLVIHAGDVTSPDVLETLRGGRTPVVAVLGNNDGEPLARWGATHDVLLDLHGTPTAVIHDAGPRKGRRRRMRRAFPDARLVIYGHSHIPLDEDDGDLRLLNPGSPTWKRTQPFPTFVELTAGRDRLTSRLVRVGAAA